jgi:hypothetical protein
MIAFFEDYGIASTLTSEETASILDDVEREVLNSIPKHVERLRGSWEHDYDPDDYFDALRSSIGRFVDALGSRVDGGRLSESLASHVRTAVRVMEEEYVSSSSTTAPAQQSAAKSDSLSELFRDVDQ